ncbi:MAG: acetate--CoA ligase family protein [Candidatus Micrarchaeia archaeon]
MDFSLLSKYGIPFAPFKIAKSLPDALSASKEIGFPVVMKAISPQALHKSDIGGVILGIGDAKEAEGAYKTLEQRFSGMKLEGVLVQKMLGRGKNTVELIVGGKRDAQFGQLIMLGMGGVFVEVYRDVAFRVCPIGNDDAIEMIHELKSFPILMGARGRKPANISSLASALVRVSRLLEKENPSEFDINPLLVDEHGCVAVDVRLL